MFPTKNIDKLIKDLQDDKTMALFLGSGIDISYVYPIDEKDEKDCKGYLRKAENPKKWVMNWDNLLLELQGYAMLDSDEEKAMKDIDNPLKAAILKERLGTSYIPIIRNWLYTRCNETTLKDSAKYFLEYKQNPTVEKLSKVPFATHFVIAELILKKESIRAIFTQNYNNFITKAIEILWNNRTPKDKYRENIVPLDVYSGWKEYPFKKDCLLIYHVHGYIPAPSELKPKEESNHIVLTDDEFNLLSKDVYSWVNASQLHFLTHHTCVLWGLSLNDLTSLRLLRHANLEKSSEHVYWLRGGRIDADDATQRLKARYFETQHLTVVNDADGYTSLYHKLLQSIN